MRQIDIHHVPLTFVDAGEGIRPVVYAASKPLTGKFLSQYKPLIFEFLRYFIVGGLAFIVDFSVLYLSKTFLFSGLEKTGILLATALGFVAGLVFNYVLSFIFVFKQIDEKARQHKAYSFVVFTIIGILGLFITEFGMLAGISLFGQNWYPLIKIVTAGIVLIWNYTARKILIFKGAKRGQ
jgi:putative flippase GtrA